MLRVHRWKEQMISLGQFAEGSRVEEQMISLGKHAEGSQVERADDKSRTAC
jgi:hypothetical protein